ncbi:MAG: hypothetical protein AAFS11_01300 [Planctomycetota bacterium]
MRTPRSRAGLAVAVTLVVSQHAIAQDCLFLVQQTSEPGLHVVSAQFFQGSLPAGATRVSSIWADVGFEISEVIGQTGSPIAFAGFNPAFRSALFGDPVTQDGDATTPARFQGFQPPESLGGSPDPSDPLYVASFRYNGPLEFLDIEIVGQNTALFDGPTLPFGAVELYQDAAGNSGRLSFAAFPAFGIVDTANLADFIVIPAPAPLTLVPLALTATRRRRN